MLRAARALAAHAGVRAGAALHLRQAPAGRVRHRRRVERRRGRAARAVRALAGTDRGGDPAPPRRPARGRRPGLPARGALLGRRHRRGDRAGVAAACGRDRARQPAHRAADRRGVRRPARPVRRYRKVRRSGPVRADAARCREPCRRAEPAAQRADRGGDRLRARNRRRAGGAGAAARRALARG